MICDTVFAFEIIDNKVNILGKRKLTPGYIIFYILFLPDTWRVLIGIIASYLIVPAIASSEMHYTGRVMFYIMLACIGYAASAVPSRWITQGLKKWILPNK
jgi:hypothetical protein